MQPFSNDFAMICNPGNGPDSTVPKLNKKS